MQKDILSKTSLYKPHSARFAVPNSGMSFNFHHTHHEGGLPFMHNFLLAWSRPALVQAAEVLLRDSLVITKYTNELISTHLCLERGVESSVRALSVVGWPDDSW